LPFRPAVPLRPTTGFEPAPATLRLPQRIGPRPRERRPFSGSADRGAPSVAERAVSTMNDQSRAGTGLAVELRRRYLQASRDRLVSVLDGLDEHDVRRPLTPTGTNLVGLVEHLIGIEPGYLGSRSPSPNTTAGAARFATPHDLKNQPFRKIIMEKSGNRVSAECPGSP
jgi:hypothetical protein